MTPSSTGAPAAASRSRARRQAVEEIARQLLPRASTLTRLLWRRSASGLARAEAGILSALAVGPLRITEIAATQALAQPTVTQLVARLEERGYVARAKDPDDARVVLVSLSDAGLAALEGFREEYRGVLRDHLAERSDEEVFALAAASELLQDLVDALQREVRP